MELLIGFTPFIAFAVTVNALGPAAALALGAVVAIGVVIRTYIVGKREFRVLEVGTTVLMTALALYTLSTGAMPSLVEVRLWVDCGLIAIVLLSMAMRRPFTIQYAKD